MSAPIEQPLEHTDSLDCPACKQEEQAAIDGIKLVLDDIGPDGWHGFLLLATNISQSYSVLLDHGKREGWDGDDIAFYFTNSVMTSLGDMMNDPRVQQLGEEFGLYSTSDEQGAK